MQPRRTVVLSLALLVLSACGSDPPGSADDFGPDTFDPDPFVPSCGELVVTPLPFGFGRVPIGTTAEQRLTIEPPESCSVRIDDIVLTGSEHFDIDVDPRIFPLSLGGPGELTSFAVDVEFSAEVYGIHAANLEITTESDIVVVFMQAETVRSTLLCSPDPLDFGDAIAGRDAVETVSCINQTPGSLTVTRVDLQAPDDDVELGNVPAAIEQPDGLTLPQGDDLRFDVRVRPDEHEVPYDLDAAVTVHWDAGRHPETETIEITGRALPDRCPEVSAEAWVEGRIDDGVASVIDWAMPLDRIVLDARDTFDPEGDAFSVEWALTGHPRDTSPELTPWPEEPDDRTVRVMTLPLSGIYELSVHAYDRSPANGCPPVPAIEVVVAPTDGVFVQVSWHNPLDPDETDRAGSSVRLHAVELPGDWFGPTDASAGNPTPDWGDASPIHCGGAVSGQVECFRIAEPNDCSWIALGAHYAEKQFGIAYASVSFWVDGEETDRLADRPLVDGQDFWDIGRLHWPSGQLFRVDEITDDVDPAQPLTPELTPEMREAVADVCPPGEMP